MAEGLDLLTADAWQWCHNQPVIQIDIGRNSKIKVPQEFTTITTNVKNLGVVESQARGT